ncbi:hypothetical protein DYB28_005197 [Aphanomyces astaci]|uniref:Uncharacterized protein n=1 Tax=Aphanomyces astaci TaxID=112090 RepID=A0A9X8DXE1_APHAT|nr:hypothetical protein DYB28_005197 [Aphanomyces astaci]
MSNVKLQRVQTRNDDERDKQHEDFRLGTQPSQCNYRTTSFLNSSLDTSITATMAARATYNFTKTWLTDPSTYPIIAIMTVALTGASFTMMRYSTQHPDVHFDKDRRQDFFTYQPGEGEHWRAHRFTLANGKRNPINQSQLFDPMFERPENHHIHR